jgi:preprotein translocase subunit SecG
MLYSFLRVFLVLDSFVLIGAILLQAGKGTGLAANFGGASSSPDAFIGIRQAGNLLTKATWWCAGVFLGLAFVMQIMSTRTRVPRSVLEESLPNTPAQTAPAPGSSPTTAVPLTPVPQGTAAPNTAPTTKGGTTAPVTKGGTTAPTPPPTKR